MGKIIFHNISVLSLLYSNGVSIMASLYNYRTIAADSVYRCKVKRHIKQSHKRGEVINLTKEQISNIPVPNIQPSTNELIYIKSQYPIKPDWRK